MSVGVHLDVSQFVRICCDQLRSELGFDSVEDDSQDEISFVSWIGLIRQILVGQSGFERLDLMLHVVPTCIAGVSQS